MAPYIINIQKYAIHDGGGIRVSVFFKGCPLRCAWCHNPESQDYMPELLYDSKKCDACGMCSKACEAGHIIPMSIGPVIDREKCRLCGRCEDACLSGAIKLCGKKYSTRELVALLLKDRMFYEASGGGVTLTGGEVMASDMDYVEDLLCLLKKNGINTAIDTCGYADYRNFERLLPYTDLFLYDIKHVDADKHLWYTGADNGIILDNLTKLGNSGANVNIRIPVIGGFNTDAGDMEAIADFVKHINASRISLLPYHSIAKGKYEQLGRSYDFEFKKPSHEYMESLPSKFAQCRCEVIQP